MVSPNPGNSITIAPCGEGPMKGGASAGSRETSIPHDPRIVHKQPMIATISA